MEWMVRQMILASVPFIRPMNGTLGHGLPPRLLSHPSATRRASQPQYRPVAACTINRGLDTQRYCTIRASAAGGIGCPILPGSGAATGARKERNRCPREHGVTRTSRDHHRTHRKDSVRERLRGQSIASSAEKTEGRCRGLPRQNLTANPGCPGVSDSICRSRSNQTSKPPNTKVGPRRRRSCVYSDGSNGTAHRRLSYRK